MAKIALCTALLLSALCGSSFTLAATDFFPDTGKAALTQHATELREHLRVVSIALRPGEEDCATLAYLRLGHGAQVTSLYLTNGEKGELDGEELYPFDVAALRRVEATNAMARLAAEALFLNLTDPDAGASAVDVRREWNLDTLELRLRRVLEPTQPDLILLMTDKRDGATSGGMIVAREAALRLCARMQGKVGQMLVEGSNGANVRTLLKQMHPVWRRSYLSMGDTVENAYGSLIRQQGPATRSHTGRFAVLFSRGARNMLLRRETPLDGRMPDSLRRMEKAIQELASFAMRISPPGSVLIPRLLPVLQSVDRALMRTAHEESREHRILLDWKEALEQLRSAALGVHVQYSLEYSVLCERQLVRLGFEEIRANVPLSSMELYLPEVARGWIVNEAMKNRVPVHAGDTLRLITPEKLDYDFPLAENAGVRPAIGHPFPIILVHAGRKKEETFIYRMTLKMYYAPRFTAEALTPIVRLYDGEQLLTRLTNHSRDGVADRLAVKDSLASSTVARVALRRKEAVKIDTLYLNWRDAIPNGTYMVPVTYGGVPVCRFLARKFSCVTDTSRRVGVLSAWRSSALREALRRLECRHVQEIPQGGMTTDILGGLQTVFVDRRALTLRGLSTDEAAALTAFVNAGGHLVVLAQDPEAWNACLLWQELRLGDAVGLPPGTAVSLDTADVLLSSPNRITRDDFDNWLQRRSYNAVDLHGDGTEGEVVVRAADGMPLLVSRGLGKGRMTYLDLALGPQWMNISAGALRLLGNLVAR